MKTKTFDLEELRLIEEITKREARRVLIQLPQGLKAEGLHLASVAEQAGATAIISTDPCYGSCDLATVDAEDLGVDLIVHYGHSPMTHEEKVQVLYIEARARISPKAALRSAIPLLDQWSRIGLFATIQHIHTLEESKKMLLKSGKTVAIGNAGHLRYPGQVTGCDYTNAKAVSKGVEALLLIGGGRFHAVGLALATAKPTVVADPYEKRAYSVDKEVKRIIIQRWTKISEARQAKTFGVLVGLKSGQRKLDLALVMREKLEKKKRNAILLAAKEIRPETLLELSDVDAFVNTACPRVSVDDAANFPKPVLTPNEILVALDEMSWEQLCRRGWFESTT